MQSYTKFGDKLFTILVDDSRDISYHSLGTNDCCSLYVNKCGEVIEQFLDMVHVTDTSSKCLKDVTVASFAKYDLSVEVERSRI